MSPVEAIRLASTAVAAFVLGFGASKYYEDTLAGVFGERDKAWVEVERLSELEAIEKQFQRVQKIDRANGKVASSEEKLGEEWWLPSANSSEEIGSADSFLAISETYPIYEFEKVLEYACDLAEKRIGTPVMQAASDTSVQLWVNEGKEAASVTLGGSLTRRDAESIAYYATGNSVSEDILIEPAESWSRARSAVEVATECKSDR